MGKRTEVMELCMFSYSSLDAMSVTNVSRSAMSPNMFAVVTE